MSLEAKGPKWLPRQLMLGRMTGLGDSPFCMFSSSGLLPRAAERLVRMQACWQAGRGEEAGWQLDAQ